jgi:hypothetical protein
LERDRAAVLTVRSAVSGVVDYRDADIMDRRWWLRWRLLLNEMTAQEDCNLMRELYSYHLALVSNSGLTDDSFKSTQKTAKGNFEDIINSMRPWLGTKEDRLDGEADQMKEDWKHFFGWDLDDPEAVKTWHDHIEEMTERGLHPEREEVLAEEEQQRFAAAIERVKERRARAHRDR